MDHTTNLDSGQHDTAVGVLKLRHYAFANMFRLFLIFRAVLRNSSENCYPTPLGAFAQRDKQLDEQVRVELEYRALFACLLCVGVLDLCQRRDRVRDDLKRCLDQLSAEKNNLDDLP